jgi:hypothetical protein
MRYNHDPEYNQNLPDSGVAHVQYVTFESLFDSERMDSIDDFMGKHGRKFFKCVFLLLAFFAGPILQRLGSLSY